MSNVLLLVVFNLTNLGGNFKMPLGGATVDVIWNYKGNPALMEYTCKRAEADGGILFEAVIGGGVGHYYIKSVGERYHGCERAEKGRGKP